MTKNILILTTIIYSFVLVGCSDIALKLDNNASSYIAADFLKTAKIYYPPAKTSLNIEDNTNFNRTLIALARKDGYAISKYGLLLNVYIDKLDEVNKYRATYKIANQSNMSRIYVYCDTNKLCPVSWTDTFYGSFQKRDCLFCNTGGRE